MEFFVFFKWHFQENTQVFKMVLVAIKGDFCVWKYKDDTKAAKMDFWYPEAGKALEHFKSNIYASAS